MSLTERQTAVLRFVCNFIALNGYPPTRREISEHFGFRSNNAAEEHLRALASKGAIVMRPGVARGLSVVEDA